MKVKDILNKIKEEHRGVKDALGPPGYLLRAQNGVWRMGKWITKLEEALKEKEENPTLFDKDNISGAY